MNPLLRWDLGFGSLLHLDSTLSLDKSSDKLRHLTFLDLTVTILIELFEKDIELVNRDGRLALELHELIQEVEGLQLVESSTIISVISVPDRVNESICLIVGLIGKSHFPLELLYVLVLVLELGLEVADLGILLPELRLELDDVGCIEAFLLQLELLILLLSHLELLLVLRGHLG